CGVELPFTCISVRRLALRIHSLCNRAAQNHQYFPAIEAPIKQEFVFGTSVTTTEGNQFNFVEEAMHQCVKYLPAALKAVNEGRNPEDREIYTLGMPTNVLGYIPLQFAYQLRCDPIGKLSEVYAELIDKEMNKFSNLGARVVELYGVSMGASLAVRIGERLI